MSVTELPAIFFGPGLTASVAAQLRAAADFLDNTPGVKVSPFAGTTVWFFCATTDEVDEMAALLGMKARWEDHHYSVRKHFGNEVTYSALHVCKGRCQPPTVKPESGEAA